MLKLVPYSEKVFEAMYAWQTDEEIRKDMGGLSVPMREDEMLFSYQQFLTGNNAVLGVGTEEGKIVGAFIMEKIEPRHKRLEVHIVFDKEFLRHVGESCKLFLDYIFNERHFDWVIAYIGINNEKSNNLVERLGFVKRGILPDYFSFQNGVEHANIYSLHKLKRKEI